MKRTSLILNVAAVLVLCLYLSACNIPGISGIPGITYNGKFTEEKDLTATATGIETLDAITTNGNITVTVAAGPDIKIHISKIIQARTQSEADELGPKVNFHAEPQGSTLKVYYDYPKEWKIRVDAEYTITCPPAIAQLLKTTNGSITAKGVEKTVEGRTTNGNIKVEGGQGAIYLSTTNGNLSAVNTSITGKSKFTTTNGDVEVMTKSASAPLYAGSTNGTITISLPAAFVGQVDAKLTNGRIRTDFTVTNGTTTKTKLQGVVGTGGETVIQVRTTNGDISFRKTE